MKDLSHSTPNVCPELPSNGEIVSIFVDYDHPLLQLGRALPWEQITEVMIREWRLSGKNVDGGPGRSLIVLAGKQGRWKRMYPRMWWRACSFRGRAM